MLAGDRYHSRPAGQQPATTASRRTGIGVGPDRRNMSERREGRRGEDLESAAPSNLVDWQQHIQGRGSRERGSRQRQHSPGSQSSCSRRGQPRLATARVTVTTRVRCLVRSAGEGDVGGRPNPPCRRTALEDGAVADGARTDGCERGRRLRTGLTRTELARTVLKDGAVADGLAADDALTDGGIGALSMTN